LEHAANEAGDSYANHYRPACRFQRHLLFSKGV
jgi:hypothetical protein